MFVSIVLGVLLVSPALGSGLLADDVGQRAFILAKLAGRLEQPWWDLFTLVRATPEQLERMRSLGQLPWWTGTELQISFWRPLTAATHYLDYALWPERPWLMHLHQLGWYAVACGLAWRLFRRLASSDAAAGAAAILFAATHLHVSAAAWLAHRNAVVVLVFGLASLLAHDRWRREAWRPGAVLGPLAFLAALLGGELGVGVLGFVIAHALVLDRAARGRALATLLPYLIVLIGWRWVYDALGYGVHGSGVYVDPLHEPGLWLHTVPRRLLELMIYSLGPPGRIGANAYGRMIGAALVLAAGAITARAEPSRRRVLGHAALGLGLTLVPLTTTVAHDRLLVLATVGSCLAFGELLDAGLARAQLGVRLGASVVALVHLLLSPLATVLVAANVELIKVSGAGYPIAAGLDDAKLRKQSLFVLHTPSLLTANLLASAREQQGLNRPNFTWVLHAEPSDSLELRRVDDRTLELHDPNGWLRGPDSLLMRGPAQPFVVGDEVRTLDHRLRVLEVVDGRPTRISVQLRSRLDASSFVFVSWAGDDFEPCPAAIEGCLARPPDGDSDRN